MKELPKVYSGHLISRHSIRADIHPHSRRAQPLDVNMVFGGEQASVNSIPTAALRGLAASDRRVRNFACDQPSGRFS